MKLDWRNLLYTLLPTILMFVPGVPATLVPTIIHGIEEAETLFKSPTEKKQHVLNLVSAAIDTVNLTNAAKPPFNKDKVLASVSGAIDLAVLIVNRVHRTATPDTDKLA